MTDMESIIQYLCSKFNIRYHNNIHEYPIHCPFHEDSKKSASINFKKQLFNCFPCGKGYNLEQLYNLLQEMEKDIKPQVTKVSKLNKINTTKVHINHTHAVDYLVNRGLSPDNIPIQWELSLSTDPDLLPFYGYIIFESGDGYISGRNLIEDERPKYRNEPNEKGLFWIAKDEQSKIVFLVEGIFDGLSLYELGMKNICCSMGAGFPKKSANNIAYEMRGTTVLILYDNDPAGYKGGKSVSDTLKEFEVDHVVLELPKALGNDPNECLVNNRQQFYQWLLTVLDKFNPDDKHYTKFLFRSKDVKPLNIIPSGIKELDNILTGGFKDGGHIISGNTGIGKTTFIKHLAINAVMNYGKRGMVNSCELSKKQSWARIASKFSKFTWEELEENPLLLEDHAYKQVQEVSNNLVVVNGWPLKRIIQEADKYDFLIIDYVQRVREAYGSDQAATRHLINNYVASLTDLGALHGKVCIMVSSLGRASYDKPDDYGLKESGSMEYMGTTVSRIIPIGDPMNGSFYWKVQKNTRGERGDIKLTGVDLGHSNFDNITAESVG